MADFENLPLNMQGFLTEMLRLCHVYEVEFHDPLTLISNPNKIYDHIGMNKKTKVWQGMFRGFKDVSVR